MCQTRAHWLLSRIEVNQKSLDRLTTLVSLVTDRFVNALLFTILLFDKTTATTTAATSSTTTTTAAATTTTTNRSQVATPKQRQRWQQHQQQTVHKRQHQNQIQQKHPPNISITDANMTNISITSNVNINKKNRSGSCDPYYVIKEWSIVFTPMQPFSRRRWRLESSQLVSSCVYKIAK